MKKKIASKTTGTGADESEDDWSRIWDARARGLEKVLGPSADRVLHAAFPLEFGGFADVMIFPKFPGGTAYVTADLTGKNLGQKPNRLGNYELMICSRRDEPQLGSLISHLARWSLERKFEVGDVFKLDSTRDPNGMFDAVLFCEGVPQPKFRALDEEWGLLLCLGITADEAKLAAADGGKAVIQRRMKDGTFPFSTPRRKALHEKPFWDSLPAKAPAKDFKGASAEFLSLVEQSLADLRGKLDALDREWKLASFAQWEMSQDTGELVFTLLDGLRVCCAAQVVGSFCPKDRSWEWAWNNPNVVKPLTKVSAQLKKSPIARQSKLLTTGQLKASRDAGWAFTALAAAEGKAHGAYLGDAGGIEVFFTFGKPRIEK